MLELAGYSELEPLYRGSRSLLLRGQRAVDGRSVVVKTPASDFPSSADLRKLRYEFELGRAAHLVGTRPNVVRHLELVTAGSSLGLVLEDFGGRSLEHERKGTDLSVDEFMDVAVALAGAVHSLHDAALIHLDINPSNVLYNRQSGELRL